MVWNQAIGTSQPANDIYLLTCPSLVIINAQEFHLDGRFQIWWKGGSNFQFNLKLSISFDISTFSKSSKGMSQENTTLFSDNNYLSYLDHTYQEASVRGSVIMLIKQLICKSKVILCFLSAIICAITIIVISKILITYLSRVNSVKWPLLSVSSRSSVDGAPARCSGGHGFNLCRRLRSFPCPTLLSCWSIHLSYFITELKIHHLYWFFTTHNDFDSANPISMQDTCHIWAQLNDLALISCHGHASQETLVSSDVNKTVDM